MVNKNDILYILLINFTSKIIKREAGFRHSIQNRNCHFYFKTYMYYTKNKLFTRKSKNTVTICITVFSTLASFFHTAKPLISPHRMRLSVCISF